jgi:alpha-L-rhamnosidase
MAMSTPITPADFSALRWRGHWIWAEPVQPGGFMPGAAETGPRPEARGLFRKTFTLDTVPARVPARITADSRYALYVNGELVGRGPVRCQPRRLHYDMYDLAPYLEAGENTIAAYVVYYGIARSFWQPASPNVTLGRTGVMVFEADLPGGWLVSDPTWKALKSDAWLQDWRSDDGMAMISEGVPLEVVDARRLPAGWQQPAFDDATWSNAAAIPAIHIGGFARTQPPTDPYGPMYPRPIGPLGGDVRTPVSVRAEYVAGAPDAAIGDPVRRLQAAIPLAVTGAAAGDSLPITVKVPADGCARIIMDMGVIVMGQVQFTVNAPAGTEFDFSYTEDPLVRTSGFLGMHAGTRYVARGSDDGFTVFDALGFRYVYLLIHGAAGQATLRSFGVHEDIYPWQPGAEFRCSDETLNRIYTAGIRTVQLNSRDSFTDCPTREQRAWVGDSVVHQMVHLATNTDWRLAWHYLTLADSPRSDGIMPMSVVGEIESSGSQTIPDWSLHWVHGVYNLYRFTGDRDIVKAHMPSIERVLRWYAPFQNSQGQLEDLIEWNLIDWSSLFVEGVSSIITAVWARGLREFAEMAGWLEEKASQQWAAGLYAKVQAGFEMFWDEARGSYIDHIVNGERRPAMSQLAGALAIVSGLAPKERWPRIAEVITDPARLVVRSWTGAAGEYSPEKMMKQFQGIYEADWDVEREVVIAEPFMSYVTHDAVAQAGLADRLPDLYQRWDEFLTGGYDTIGECWGWGTHVHGWSCTPTRDMVFYTLGVTPAAPGYTTAHIAPRLGKLSWAEGKVPTPHGLITVHAEPGRVTVDSPIPVIVELPGHAPQSLPAGKHEIAD